MSAFDTPEIATLHGALDSDGQSDGIALNAHHLRVLTMNANHQLAKGQHLITILVPRQEGDAINATDASPYFNTWTDGIRSWVPTTGWVRLTAPVPFPKKPGLNRAEVRLHARISESHTVWLQVATKGRPFQSSAGPSSPNVIELTGDGDNDVDSYTKTGLWIDPGRYEELEIFVKGLTTSDSADTTVGGTPNDRGDVPASNFGYLASAIQASSSIATWEVPGWSRYGAEIEFRNADNEVIARRTITSVSESDDIGGGVTIRRLHFTPELTASTLQQVQLGDDWYVWRLPTIGLVSLTLAGEERTR